MLQWRVFAPKASSPSLFTSWLKTWRNWATTRGHQALRTHSQPHLAGRQRSNCTQHNNTRDCLRQMVGLMPSRMFDPHQNERPIIALNIKWLLLPVCIKSHSTVMWLSLQTPSGKNVRGNTCIHTSVPGVFFMFLSKNVCRKKCHIRSNQTEAVSEIFVNSVFFSVVLCFLLFINKFGFHHLIVHVWMYKAKTVEHKSL